GVEVAKNVLRAETSTLDFDIEAFIVKPEITRANRRYVTLIVNGRYIRNYSLTQAIIQGYGTLLPIHRFPITIVYITLNPVIVDVNVHTTKLEVRFSKEKELAKVIENLVRDTFKSESLIPEIRHNHTDKRKTEQEAFQLHMPNNFKQSKRQEQTGASAESAAHQYTSQGNSDKRQTIQETYVQKGEKQKDFPSHSAEDEMTHHDGIKQLQHEEESSDQVFQVTNQK